MDVCLPPPLSTTACTGTLHAEDARVSGGGGGADNQVLPLLATCAMKRVDMPFAMPTSSVLRAPHHLTQLYLSHSKQEQYT